MVISAFLQVVAEVVDQAGGADADCHGNKDVAVDGFNWLHSQRVDGGDVLGVGQRLAGKHVFHGCFQVGCAHARLDDFLSLLNGFG